MISGGDQGDSLRLKAKLTPGATPFDFAGGDLYVRVAAADSSTVVLTRVLAGPTCDSADVLYEREPYALPVSLEIGDKVLIEGTGAYTATYSSVAFNGFSPLKTYHI